MNQTRLNEPQLYTIVLFFFLIESDIYENEGQILLLRWPGVHPFHHRMAARCPFKATSDIRNLTFTYLPWIM